MADGRNRAALEPVEVIVTHSSPSFPNQCLQFVHNNHATLESTQPTIMYHKDPTLLHATCKYHNLELLKTKEDALERSSDWAYLGKILEGLYPPIGTLDSKRYLNVSGFDVLAQP
jgi:hypothetical protein